MKPTLSRLCRYAAIAAVALGVVNCGEPSTGLSSENAAQQIDALHPALGVTPATATSLVASCPAFNGTLAPVQCIQSHRAGRAAIVELLPDLAADVSRELGTNIIVTKLLDSQLKSIGGWAGCLAMGVGATPAAAKSVRDATASLPTWMRDMIRAASGAKYRLKKADYADKSANCIDHLKKLGALSILTGWSNQRLKLAIGEIDDAINLIEIIEVELPLWRKSKPPASLMLNINSAESTGKITFSGTCVSSGTQRIAIQVYFQSGKTISAYSTTCFQNKWSLASIATKNFTDYSAYVMQTLGSKAAVSWLLERGPA